MKVVEKGTPEVKQAVEKGELSVKRAYEIVQHPPEEQKKLLQEPQPKPQPQVKKIDKAKWPQVYSAFMRNQSVEGVEKLASELGVTVDEVLRVINLVKTERGELPISLSTLSHTKPTSQPMLKPLEGGTPTPTTPTHATTTPTTPQTTIKRKEEEDVIVLSDPFVVAGVRAYAREQRMTLEQAASQIIVEYLTQLGIKW